MPGPNDNGFSEGSEPTLQIDCVVRSRIVLRCQGVLPQARCMGLRPLEFYRYPVSPTASICKNRLIGTLLIYSSSGSTLKVRDHLALNTLNPETLGLTP